MSVWFVPEKKILTHVQQVQRLYRQSLRLAKNWAIGVDVFEFEADRIRSRFEAARFEQNRMKIQALMNAAKQELADKDHPSPYIVPWMPGGSMYQRNSPPPPEVCFPGEGIKSPTAK